MPGNSSIIETMDTKVIEYLEEISQVKQGKINTIGFRAYDILYGSVDTEDEEGLDQQVDRDQENNID